MLWLLACVAQAVDVPDPVVGAELGSGVRVIGVGATEFQIRLRGQFRATVAVPEEPEEDPAAWMQVRRLRLVFLGKVPDQDLQVYVQLGFATSDMEPDLLVPLRDAVVTWSPGRDFGLKIGQQKVPFNRERVVSSSALQFPDRSIANGELTLDRDIGIQAFSNDLFGLGERVAYQIGVFNGDGRNRWTSDLGLLAVARLEVRPLGAFPDSYTQADLTRGPTRLVMGMGVARNHDSARAKSTHGDVYQVAAFDQTHAQIDVMCKSHGFSFHAEALARVADRGRVEGVGEDGAPIAEASRSGWGWSAAAGYVFPGAVEPAVRVSEVLPWPDGSTALEPSRETRAGLSWYGHGHDFKVQTDYGRLGGRDRGAVGHEVRTQLQVFF